MYKSLIITTTSMQLVIDYAGDTGQGQLTRLIASHQHCQVPAPWFCHHHHHHHFHHYQNQHHHHPYHSLYKTIDFEEKKQVSLFILSWLVTELISLVPLPRSFQTLSVVSCSSWVRIELRSLAAKRMNQARVWSYVLQRKLQSSYCLLTRMCFLLCELKGKKVLFLYQKTNVWNTRSS